MPDYDALRAQEARAQEFTHPEDLEEAFRSISAPLARTAKAMVEIGVAARRLNRDLIRWGRRPPLIHKGGRPRG